MAAAIGVAKVSPSDPPGRMMPGRGHRVTGWERYMALDRSEGHSMTCFTRFWFRAAIDRGEFVRAVGLLAERNPLLSAHPGGPCWLPVPYDARTLIDWQDAPQPIDWSHLPADDFRTRWIVRRGPLRKLGLDADEYGEAEGTLVVLQYPHAVADALGAVALMCQLCCMLADEEARIPDAAGLDHRVHLGMTSLDWWRRLSWDAERIWHYFRRRPLSLTATVAPGPRSGRIQFIRRAVSRHDSGLLCTASRTRGVTVNDVLLAAFLRALARRTETSGWIRIAVPTSLRPQGNDSFCNLVSMVFLDRTASQAAREDVLADISREMSLIKERSLGHAMLRFLAMGGLGRGLFMKPFLRSGRTETTAVLSNLGRLFQDPAWQHPVGLRPIATDTVSPLRPGTNVSLSASHCDGRLSLTLRYDEAALDAEMARRMLSEVIDESISLVTAAGLGLGAPCGQTR